MNVTDLPVENADLPPEILAIATALLMERDDITTMPVNTGDMPEFIVDEILELLETHATSLRLPQVIRELPADVTPVDVAKSVVALAGSSIRFNPESQAWLVFDSETGWKWDPLCHRVHGLVVDVLRELAEYEPIGLDTTQHRRFTRTRRSRARRMQNIGVIRGIASLVSMNSSIYCPSSDIDANPVVVGTPRGALDLRNGDLIPYGPNEFITRRVPLDLDVSAKCPRWEQFLREVLCDDAEIQDYFHQLVGYIVSGETTLQQMWLLVGSGSNGKSTLLHILQKVLGPDYAQQTPESVLLGRANLGGATSDLVRLKGVRCALLAETGHGQSFNEERVKALVAADTITARGLYREFEEFVPQAKFLLATNHLPIVRGADKGIWRRLVVIPFKKEFEVGSDPTLYQDLVAELPGIFAWAVRGAVRWYDSNVPFTVPSAWRLATSQYRTEQDAIRGFLDERVVVDKIAFVGATELYGEYVGWCAGDGRGALSQSEFGQRMMATGLVTKERKFKANRCHYVGVRLRAADETELGALVDDLFADHSAPPPGPALIPPDGLLTEASH